MSKQYVENITTHIWVVTAAYAITLKTSPICRFGPAGSSAVSSGYRARGAMAASTSPDITFSVDRNDIVRS